MANYKDKFNEEVLNRLNGKPHDVKVINDTLTKMAKTINSRTVNYITSFTKEDFIQEAHLAFLIYLPRYNPEKAPAFTYFYYVVKSHFLTLLNKDQNTKNGINRITGSLEYLTGDKNDIEMHEIIGRNLLTEMNEFNASTENAVISNENINEMYMFMEERCSKLEQSILHFRILGYSYEEISEELEIPYKSVDNALHRTRKKYGIFKEDMEKIEEFNEKKKK